MAGSFRCVLILGFWCLATSRRVQNPDEDLALDGGRRRRTFSRYKVGPNWDTMSFDERWKDFQSSVPFERFQGGENPGHIPDGDEDGESCVPWLWGPEDAENLVILVHGFLSCPGRWGLLVKELLQKEVTCGLPSGSGAEAPRPCGRYRIMGLTLPGHGYKWEEVPTKVARAAANSTGRFRTVSESKKDDITDMPFDKEPWFVFNEAVGSMAEKFKEEHPNGLVSIDGHSIGGMMSLFIAIRRPTVFDRVLIQNPELGPSSSFLWPVGATFKHFRLSIDALSEDCEAERLSGQAFPGGTCQFKLGNINSVWSFSKEVYCKQWQIARCTLTGFSFDQKAFNETRRNFSLLKSFQMVQTRNDPAVEQKRILMFMQELDKVKQHDDNVGLCTFPAVMGHTYLTPNYAKHFPGGPRNNWWAPYAMDALVRYLTEGRTIPIVYRTARVDWKDATTELFKHVPGILRFLMPFYGRFLQKGDYCLPDSHKSVLGTDLTILPSLQNDEGYFLAGEGYNRTFARVLDEASERIHFKGSKKRVTWQELLSINDTLLLVERASRNARVEHIWILSERGRKISSRCMEVGVESIKRKKPLLVQLEEHRVHPKPEWVTFCGAKLVAKFCTLSVIECT